MKRLLLVTACLFPAMPVLADAPDFDRPGIGFATSVLPKGSLAWEQGLPDMVRQKEGGATSTQYDANAQLRYGLHEKVELQLGGAMYSRRDDKAAGIRDTEEGAGDASVAVKAALPSVDDAFSWALLAGVSLPTGSKSFTRDREAYFFGVTTDFTLSDTQSVALYYNVDYDSKESNFTFSPSWSYRFNEKLGGFVEAGYTVGDIPHDNYVAGGGLTYRLMPRVQADIYSLWGLNKNSTDFQAGLGISAFFD